MKKNKKLIIGIAIGLVVVIVSVVIVFFLTRSEEESIDPEKVEFVSQYFENDSLDTEDDWLSLQDTSNNLINLSISEQNPLEEATVIINPYEISPLTAVIIFETSSSQVVELIINDESYMFESATSHVIPIYGLIAGEINTVTITTDDGSKDFELDMTEEVFDIDVDVLINEGNLYDDAYLFTNPNEEGAYAINSDGDVVWHLDSDLTLTPIILDNGHLLLSTSDFSSDLYSRNGFVEIDYLGKIYSYYEVEGGYHHDLEVLPSGNVLVGSTDTSSDTTLDYIVEIDFNTGKTVKEISLADIFSEIDSSIIDSATWLFNNGISYDKSTNSILVSTRLKNSVISIDYDTLDINWIFGDSVYWSSAFDEYLIEYDGDYPLGMHSAEINSDGNLIMFNNGYDKSDPQVSDYYTDYNSSVQIFDIDEVNKTATLVSEFDDNESFFSFAVSTYNELDNGNYIVYSGWEIDKSTFNDEDYLTDFIYGNTTTIYELDDDNEILFKAEVSIASYAGITTSFYSDINSNVDISDLEFNINYDKYSYIEVDLNDIKDDLTNAEDYDFSYTLTNYSYTISAGFITSDYVNLYFIDTDGFVYMYELKEENDSLTRTIDIRNLESGEYALFLEVSGEFYKYSTTYNFR